ncbi:hypothetical protein [Gloeothece verrucosa]|uniref:Uncharacterized protein n=1 Tax=Gloeothece verrucosa (strain PCC 7822) TaxID=497965 RepID=E0UMH0_GLOV7|nr:hypothetical protein [Gloeothece verrucosa]ADN18150.1 hypothetical protein Cyan7822_6363 [Gloeothece verrucosa PCC 7822]
MNTRQEDFRAASQYSVNSNGQAVFYSGGANYYRAYYYANSSKGKAATLERTDTGRALFTLKPLNKQTNNVFTRHPKPSEYKPPRPGDPLKDNNFADRLGRVSSWRFAKSASGDVKTFVCGARSDSVFRKIELPTLIRNKKVTSINGVDRKHFEKAFKQDPSGKKAYRMACLSELRQDRRLAQKTGDKKLLADVKNRQNLYRSEFGKNKSPVLSNDRSAKLTNNARTPVAQSQQPKTSRSIGNSSTNPSSSQSLTKTPSPSTKPKTETRSQTPPPQQSPKRSR